jgi:MFS transporter, ACS family, tartrate transporter
MTGHSVFTKCAWRLIPFMMVAYLVNYLDRVNVGFAALTMNADLGFSPAVFGLGAGMFFVGYFLFQVPANIILERVGTRRWIACILASWGAMSAAGALVRDPVSFYTLRFFLGVAEAGFFPGILLYLTYWFPHSYRGRFTALFMTAIPLSFIVGGPVSSLLLEMDNHLGLRGWQWLFLLEGLPACLLALLALKMLPDGPAKAAWLTPEEKQVIATALATEERVLHRTLWPALRDPRVVALGLVYFFFGIGANGVRLWLPQIVQAMGFSNLATGFIVAAPFVLSMGVMILWGRSSDRRGERIWHIALPLFVAAAGLIATIFSGNAVFSLLALAIAVAGILAAEGPFFSFPSSFLGGKAAAGGIALVSAIGSLGGFFGPSIVGQLREATGNYSASMAALAAGLIASGLIVLAVGRAMPGPAARPAHRL